MAIVINGSGTLSGLAVGGLPDGTVDTDTLANTTVTAAKVAADVATQAEIDAKLNLAGGTLTGDLNFGDNVDANFGAGADLKIYHDATDSHLKSATGQLYINSYGNVIIRNSADTELARLDTYGRLLVGTASGADVNPSGLSVRADSYGLWTGKFAHRHSGGDGAGVLIDIENATGSNVPMMRFDVDAGTVGSIKASQSATSYNTSSDYRLKENVNYTWDATTKLKQLKPAEFNFIITPSETVEGFLAHEVSGIVPAAVTGEKDATENLTNVILKANGIVKASGVTEAEWTQGKTDDEYPSDSTWAATHTENIHQSIDQSKLVPLLVKTIQELEARITALEA